MPRYKTELVWFSRRLPHPARKQSRSILRTVEPAQGLTGIMHPEEHPSANVNDCLQCLPRKLVPPSEFQLHYSK